LHNEIWDKTKNLSKAFGNCLSEISALVFQIEAAKWCTEISGERFQESYNPLKEHQR